MKKIIALLALVLLSFTTFARAEGVAPRTRVETMFTSFKPGEIERAIDTFAKDSLIRPEVVDLLKSQAKNVLVPEKKILGFEFIQEQNVGESIKRLTYVLKIADRPLYWSFSFYKPESTWAPLRFSFSDEY
jgi:hypothetical protein